MNGSGELRFDGRVAVVTGGGGALGGAHAKLLAARGAAVMVSDTGTSPEGEGSSESVARAVASEIAAAGGTASWSALDVADSERAESLITTTLEAFGRIDVLVHSAGIVREASAAEMSGANLHDVVDVHLISAFHLVRSLWNEFCGQGYGRIVLTSSAAGLFGAPRCASYAAAKAGLMGLGVALAAEGAPHGVHTNVLVPIARSRLSTAPVNPSNVRSALELLDPALVAPLVAWLAHEECAVNGEIFSAAGGFVRRIAFALSAGFFDPGLTPETMSRQFDTIRDMTASQIPLTPADALEMRLPPDQT